jgi:hypothetical protein
MTRAQSLLRAAALFAIIPLNLANNLSNPVGFEKKNEQTHEQPLRIEIITDLNFSRAAVLGAGGGDIAVVADQSNQIRSNGVVDLGGFAMAGQAKVYGEPGRAVRIELPHVVRMNAASGGVLEISDIRSNLSPAPRLNAQGELMFEFGGRLNITGNVSGAFRGRIAITAEYE